MKLVTIFVARDQFAKECGRSKFARAVPADFDGLGESNQGNRREDFR
jgi:hypothetical protein